MLFADDARPAPRPFRHITGRKVSVHKAVAAKLDRLWSAFRSAQARAATFSKDGTYPRSLHEQIKRAGAELVEAQTHAGVWLIHPSNAVPGFRDDDPRIVEG